jgi:hypothetical protein
MSESEEYVSKKTAKLLNGKGFDWVCRTRCFYPTSKFDYEEGIYAPTLATAIRWLRERHKLYITILPKEICLIYDYDSTINAYCTGKYTWLVANDNGMEVVKGNDVDKKFQKNYEMAADAALRYCLTNLL